MKIMKYNRFMKNFDPQKVCYFTGHSETTLLAYPSPLHLTPTSLEWSQLWSPRGRDAHSRILASSPSHAYLSRNIGPSPSPKLASRNATDPTGDKSHISVTNMSLINFSEIQTIGYTITEQYCPFSHPEPLDHLYFEVPGDTMMILHTYHWTWSQFDCR